MVTAEANTRVSASQHRLSNIRKAFVKVELRVLLKPVAEALKALINRPKEVTALFQVFGDVIEATSSKEITKNLDKFVEIFFAAFEVRKHESDSERFELISKCESAVIDVFLKLVDSMSDNEVKPVMESLVKWAASGLADGAPLANRLRLITVFHFANKFYDSYHSLALPYFATLFDLCPKVLISANAAKTDEKKVLFDCQKSSPELQKLSANELVTAVLTFLTNCAKHVDFFVRERADSVYESVVDELENVKCHGHEERCVPLLSDCLYQIAEAHTQLFTDEMNNRIMLKTRNSSAKVRHRTLLVIDRLLDRIGESVAPLLPNILPFLSELLEDDNRQVEEQCDKTIRMLRSKFGSEFAAEIAA
uniref:HEAT repeat-containing protein 1 n=1 Tax=Steinernema glaseri TaxID=37863 RepID=A0A1I8A1T7_9BILA